MPKFVLFAHHPTHKMIYFKSFSFTGEIREALNSNTVMLDAPSGVLPNEVFVIPLEHLEDSVGWVPLESPQYHYWRTTWTKKQKEEDVNTD